MFASALEGIRVLEMGEGVSAAFCSRLFADYGADVVKLERPGSGDVTRGWGPFPGDRPHPEKSGVYFSLNTNKRSVTLDPDRPEAREILTALVERADVVIENESPARKRARGLDYPQLSALRPALVMISITPFGQTGPYADWKGYDLAAFHLSGTGSRYCGRPGAPPLEQGTFSADYFGGYVAATWGLAALLAPGRECGEHIDVASAEAIAALFVAAQNIGGYAQDGIFERRTGVGMPLASPATILPCQDGYVWMVALEPGQWQGLARAMGSPDWMQLELFQDMFTRAQNADLIYPLIEEWTRAHTKQEIMDLCQANGCPTTAVFSVRDVAEHPHLHERGFFAELAHAELGRVRTLGAPVHLPDGPGGPRRSAPLLGEHNDEIYRGELGVSVPDLQRLSATAVI